MTQRRLARSLALQLLYALDVSPADRREVEELFWQGKCIKEEVMEFARSLVNGVQCNRAEIDRLISEHSVNWSLERLSTVDRGILRLATYELLYCKEIPQAVSIDEAIELAKIYSTLDSPAFVNGVLDKIRKVIDAE